jgi:hypothetical protein
MAGIVILNAALAVLIVTGVVGLLTWAILTEERNRRRASEARLVAAPARRRPSAQPRPRLVESAG